MSFIDLMANHRWSDTDITNHTEAKIAARFPRWSILQRKVVGQMAGEYVLTADEQSEYDAYKLYAFQMGVLADEARADMALLEQVFALEAAQARLARPAVEPVLSEGDEPQVTNQEALNLDAAERAEAQSVVDAASIDAKNRALLRAPIPEPTPEPTPEPLP